MKTLTLILFTVMSSSALAQNLICYGFDVEVEVNEAQATCLAGCHSATVQDLDLENNRASINIDGKVVGLPCEEAGFNSAAYLENLDQEAQEITMAFASGMTPGAVLRAIGSFLGQAVSTGRNTAACVSYGTAWLACRSINDAQGDRGCDQRYRPTLQKYCL